VPRGARAICLETELEEGRVGVKIEQRSGHGTGIGTLGRSLIRQIRRQSLRSPRLEITELFSLVDDGHTGEGRGP
jgi:hypothetical protein